ncbi:MAG: tRNA (guanosine(37)-N1)-methyltransferase TrmD [Bdellovibrionia bacterium]
MKIKVITLFPEMINQSLQYGVLGGGIEKGLLEVSCLNPREFSLDKHRSVDDRPFGGGDGMVMSMPPLVGAIESAQKELPAAISIYLSPQGRKLDHTKVLELAKEKELILICGRYGGVDQRFINQHVDEELSIGDYVLSGGELGALVLIDSVSRQIPGVLGHADSAERDSFSDGLLECPSFTRPHQHEAGEVPAVLLSGNHAEIEKWRFKVSCLVTLQKRPDLFSVFEKTYVPQRKKEQPLKTQLIEFWNTQLSQSEKDILGFSDWDLERALGK